MAGKSGRIAFGGISTALVVLCLYGGNIFLNNKAFFLAAATYLTAIPFISSGIWLGIVSYGASSLLGILLIPNKVYAAAYIFFGVYPLVKLLCERYSIIVEFVLKYIWFNLTLAVIYLFFKDFISIDFESLKQTGLAVVLIAVEAAFLVYDYVFTRGIMFFEDKVIKRL